MKTHATIKELPESERPYEKFLQGGTKALSDADLLAIILKTGTANLSSLDIARELLSGSGNGLLGLYQYTLEELMAVEGIGKVKAIQLKAICELSVRIAAARRHPGLFFENSEAVAEYYMERLRHRSREHLLLVMLDGKGRLLGEEEITSGTVNTTLFPPRDIFIAALNRKAVSLIVLHNHPSGDCSPSQDDIQSTMQLDAGCKLLGISLTDHIIIGDQCYFSFADSGFWEEEEAEPEA